MICTQCKHRNGIGHKFCRECGVPLPQPASPLAIEEGERAERERLNERVSGLLSAAYTLAEQKRYDQSLPLAEEAVLLLPDSTAALSLLATLYEYSGQDEKAIRSMERVVALNPESPGDRQKLGQLRQAFQQAQSDEPFPIRGAAAAGRAAASPVSRPVGTLPVSRHPYVPYVMGGAAAACVLGLGLAIVSNRSMASHRGDERVAAVGGTTRANLGGADPTPAETAARNLTGAATGAGLAAAPPPAAYPNPSAQTYAPGADPFLSHGGNDAANNGARATPTYRYRPDGNASLPGIRLPAGGDSTGQTQPLPPIIAVAPTANGDNAAAVGPYGATESGTHAPIVRIAAGPPPSNGATDATGASANSSDGNQGYIHIVVGHAPATAGGGGSTPSNTGTVTASGALARARNLQATGKYTEAVAAYRESLGSDSGSAGAAQQGIAQSESSLHDDAAARTAYKDALHAYESQLAAGRNVGAARRGIDVCKAALENLGGG